MVPARLVALRWIGKVRSLVDDTGSELNGRRVENPVGTVPVDAVRGFDEGKGRFRGIAGLPGDIVPHSPASGHTIAHHRNVGLKVAIHRTINHWFRVAPGTPLDAAEVVDRQNVPFIKEEPIARRPRRGGRHGLTDCFRIVHRFRRKFPACCHGLRAGPVGFLMGKGSGGNQFPRVAVP